jgi:hypothetical protein
MARAPVDATILTDKDVHHQLAHFRSTPEFLYSSVLSLQLQQWVDLDSKMGSEVTCVVCLLGRE